MQQTETVKEGIQDGKKHGPYIALGIYEKGDVVVPQHYQQAFLHDATWDFALVKALPEECDGTLMCGIKVYEGSKCSFDAMNICRPETWAALWEAGFLDWPLDSYEGNPLEWIVRSAYSIDTAVFDYLKEKFPGTDMAPLLSKATRLGAAKWLDGNGADKDYAGYKYPMREMIRLNTGPETDQILAYLYGDDATKKEDNDG